MVRRTATGHGANGVLVVRSPLHAATGSGVGKTSAPCGDSPHGPDTPARAGKRQITEKRRSWKRLTCAQDQRVDGLLSVAWEKQVEQTTQYVGRGRGAVHREKQVVQKTRYHITRITRQKDTIANHCQRFGWKAFVTNAGQSGCLCRRRCCVIATNTAWNASSTASRAGSISRRCLSTQRAN